LLGQGESREGEIGKGNKSVVVPTGGEAVGRRGGGVKGGRELARTGRKERKRI